MLAGAPSTVEEVFCHVLADLRALEHAAGAERARLLARAARRLRDVRGAVYSTRSSPEARERRAELVALEAMLGSELEADEHARAA